MTAENGGFAPAPGDRRSPLQVASPAMTRTTRVCVRPQKGTRLLIFGTGHRLFEGRTLWSPVCKCLLIPGTTMATLMTTMRAVGATGSRPREPGIWVIAQNGEALFTRTHDCRKWWLCTRTGRPPVAPTGGIPCDEAYHEGLRKAAERYAPLDFLAQGIVYLRDEPCGRRLHPAIACLQHAFNAYDLRVRGFSGIADTSLL